MRRIVCSDECFHFSEVGSGKTKVILPLLCQLFLSNNAEAHKYFARSGHIKNILIVLVPEHLVADARTQVFRYCLNLNFREDYRVYDDIFALLHQDVQLGESSRLGHNKFSKGLPQKNRSLSLVSTPSKRHLLMIQFATKCNHSDRIFWLWQMRLMTF